MAGTIVVDRLESDASYASSINVASPMVISNTITMGSSSNITGNVNIDNGVLFVDQNNNRVGVNTQNPGSALDISGGVFVRGSTNPGSITNRIVIDYNGNSGVGTISANSTGGDTLLYFGTSKSGSNANRLLIDQDGRITMPAQPRFFAYNRTSNASGVSLVLNQTYLNVGSHYSTSTGRFTAPVAGTYMFVWGSLFGEANTVGRFFLQKNGSEAGDGTNNQLRLDTNPTGGEYESGEHSFMVNANPGDYFNIYFASDNGASNDGSATYTYFSGWLLA